MGADSGHVRVRSWRRCGELPAGREGCVRTRAGWRGTCVRVLRGAAGTLGRERAGQSTVEYAVVLAAFLSAVLALGAVWAFARSGGPQRLSERAASHSLDGVGGMRDIVLF